MGWLTVKWNSFPGFSRGFSAKFQGFSRMRLTLFSKNIIITYRSSACTHPTFILHFTWNCVRCWKKRLLATWQMIRCFLPPNNLIHPLPLHYRNNKMQQHCKAKNWCTENLLQNITFQWWVVISGFSREIFQGQRKSWVFQSLSGFPGFVDHPG